MQMIGLSCIMSAFVDFSNYRSPTKYIAYLGRHMLFFMGCVCATFSSSQALAKQQGELETYVFIVSGDSDSECGKGVYLGRTECTEDKSDSRFYISDKNEGKQVIDMTYTKVSNCHYHLSVLLQGDKYEIDHDFSNVYRFDYDPAGSVEFDKVSKSKDTAGRYICYYAVSGYIRGLLMPSNGKGKEEVGDYLRNVMVRASSIEAARDRFQAAFEYYRKNFCSGAAY